MKVICLKCHDIGYTASPDYVSCQCGGKLSVIKEHLTESEVVGHESTAHF